VGTWCPRGAKMVLLSPTQLRFVEALTGPPTESRPHREWLRYRKKYVPGYNTGKACQRSSRQSVQYHPVDRREKYDPLVKVKQGLPFLATEVAGLLFGLHMFRA